MKSFHEKWSDEEIKEHIDIFNVLVLFDLRTNNNTADLLIYGRLTQEQSRALLERITETFGGARLSSNVCEKINEFAEKWYNKVILGRRARVINVKRKK